MLSSRMFVRLVALMMCDDCRQKLEDQMNPNIATDLKHGLVVGPPKIHSSLDDELCNGVV
jgi:hypothetical protein